MFKRMVLMLLVVGIIFGGLFGYQAYMGIMMAKHMSGGGRPPAVVSAAKAVSQPWQSQLKAVGSLRAARGLDVTSEVPGIVKEVLFKSGQEVKDGQILLRINADTDEEHLRSLKIDAELSRTVYDRAKKQFESQAVSQAELDSAEADLKRMEAQVAQQEAVVARKVIRAPFAGRLGISAVNPGQYLNPGESIVTLQSFDSVYGDFFLPQEHISKLAVGQTIDVTTDTYPGRVFTGKISAINPRVEVDSRNILIEAQIANPKQELLPGMFVAIDIQTGAVQFYLTVPQTALTFNPYGETVYVVEEGKGPDGKPVPTVAQKFVTVGEARGDQQAVLTGIKEGDLVVTSGQLKLRNGSAVTIDNKVQPSNDPAPKPVDK